MSGIERAQYVDNHRSATMTEAILKERKIQREYFKQQEAAGKINPLPPTPPAEHKTLLQTMGIPAHITTLRQDPEAAMSLSISKSMFSGSNPGYLVRDGGRMASTMKQDYVYDMEEVELMKQQGYLDKKFNRRRDDFVMYVEASARMVHLTKGVQHANK